VASCCDHANERLVSIKGDEIFGFLTYTKNPAPVSYVERKEGYLLSSVGFLLF
jgi:hypothetical protein